MLIGRMHGQERPKLIVFDCDGTLVDSQHSIAAAMARAFELFELTPPSIKAVRRTVGLSLSEAMHRLLPQSDAALRGALVEAYRDASYDIRQRDGWHEPLFDGIRDILTAIHSTDHLLGICTGKSRRGLNALLNSHGLAEYFVTLQTADSHPGKPHPAMLENALAETGVDVADALMIGDTTFDIEMACNAGVGAVGVDWGYHQTAELEAVGATHVARSATELRAVIEEWVGPWQRK